MADSGDLQTNVHIIRRHQHKTVPIMGQSVEKPKGYRGEWSPYGGFQEYSMESLGSIVRVPGAPRRPDPRPPKTNKQITIKTLPMESLGSIVENIPHLKWKYWYS